MHRAPPLAEDLPVTDREAESVPSKGEPGKEHPDGWPHTQEYIGNTNWIPWFVLFSFLNEDTKLSGNEHEVHLEKA